MEQSVPPAMVKRGLRLFGASYRRTHLSGTFILPDVRDVLHFLHSKKIFLAVASNKPVEFTRNILKHLHLADFFVSIAGPGESIRPKPDPSMLASIMQSLQVGRGECLYVGDMRLDAETARAAGVTVALIPTGGHTREELEMEGPDFLLNRFTDLIGIVEPKIGSR
jgi:phosphoglycolate phosphatase-like HAD superfamily hydrolase